MNSQDDLQGLFESRKSQVSMLLHFSMSEWFASLPSEIYLI